MYVFVYHLVYGAFINPGMGGYFHINSRFVLDRGDIDPMVGLSNPEDCNIHAFHKTTGF